MTAPPRYPRLLATAAVLAAIIGMLGGRLVWLGTVGEQGPRPALAMSDIPARRGTLWDRDGGVVAVERYDYEVGLSLDAVGDAAALAARLAPVLGRPAPELEAALSADGRWAVLERAVDAETAAALRALEARALVLTAVPRRAYPLGAAAAHVTGFVNLEGEAHYGIEAHHDLALRGVPGALGGNFGTDPRAYRAPRDGADLVLTLDRNLQLAAYAALRETVEAQSADGGSVVVLDPATGDLLVAVSYPSYDPNDYGHYDAGRYADPIVSKIYEPGSVIKAMTVAAGIDAGAITPGATYEDVGQLEVEGMVIRNWDRLAHGRINMTEMLQYSLNVGAVHVARRVGAEGFYRSLSAFGFGTPTGVELAGEVGGILHLPSAEGADWYAGHLATNSFGQGMSSTLLQVAAAFGALANEGRLMVPRVVAARAPAGGPPVAVPPALARQVIAPATAREVRRMLGDVVSGRVTGAALPGYTVGGKTGTSQIPTAGGYEADATIASFAGFLPVDAPRVVIAVKVDRPVATRGSEVAAPLFKRVAGMVVEALGIPPDDPSATGGAPARTEADGG